MSDLVKNIPANLGNSSNLELNVKSYAGQIPFKEDPAGPALFYWFFESQNSEVCATVENTPLVIWLNGGPGASSSVGLFLENGPLRLDGENVITNPGSWNEKVHLMYWDQPVGTGYSSVGNGKYVTSEQELSEIFHTCLTKFYAIHPEYKACPLYVTGESYAGKYVPYISSRLRQDKDINLHGLAIGDGWMRPKMQLKRQLIYGFEMGFVDTKQREILETQYDSFCIKLDNAIEKGADPDTWKSIVDEGNAVSQGILECGGMPDVYDVRRWSDVSITNLTKYMNLDSVKKALHVPSNLQWQCADDSGPVCDGLMSDNMIDVPDQVFLKLLEDKKVLFYTGNFDMSCGFTGTEIMLDEMNYKEKWNECPRKIWGYPGWTDSDKSFHNGVIKGYVKSLGNLSQIVIPNAGHLVPIAQPEVSKEMLYTWIFDQEFPGYLPLKKLQ